MKHLERFSNMVPGVSRLALPGETEQMLRQTLLAECDEPCSAGKRSGSGELGCWSGLLCSLWRGLDEIAGEVK